MLRPTSQQKLTIIFFAMCVMAFCLAAVNAETLPLKTYTTSDGLAHDRVNRIVRDSRGFLWFCTSEGLSRFDGYQFKNYTQDDGLPHRSISAFLETRSGEFWLGTGDGMVFFDPRGKSARDMQSEADQATPMFRVVRPAPMPSGGPTWVRDLIEDRTGRVWAGTSNGVFFLEKGDEWRLIRFDIPAATANKNEEFARLLEDHTGAIWAATDYGLYRILPDRTTIQTIHPKLRIGSLLEDRDGRIWVGSVGGAGDEIGLHLYSINEGVPRHVRTFRKADGLYEEIWLNALLETSDGRLLIGIGNGLSEYVPDPDPSKPQFRTLSLEDVVAMGEDASGNVWFSTNSSGLRRWARGGFVIFTTADNLMEKRITSIIASSDENVYVLAEVGKIYRYDNGSFTHVKPRGMLAQSWGRGNVSFRDHLGGWWIASGYGLQRYPAVERLEDLATVQPLKTYTKRDGLFSDVIFQLLEDSRGDIWIGNIDSIPNSLTRWERATDKIYQYTAEEHGLPPMNPVTALAEDKAGNIWIGYYAGGIARYRAGKFEVFGAKDGLPPGYIFNIFCDSAGRIWVATSARGVVRIDEPDSDGPRLVTITTREGLSSNQASCTTEDNFGRIYVSTGRGVDRLDLQTGRVKVFTQADGLPENIITQCRRDSQGNLWFGTWRGLARYTPAAERPSPPPPVFFSGLRVNGESVRNLSQLGETDLSKMDFASDQRQIQVDFFALGFSVGESLRYQYKLDGVDPAWSEPTAQRTINLNLSPGNYTFLVRAVNAEGTISETPARLAFSIARPLWQRWWFLLAAATVLALAGYFIYRYRLAQLLKLERVRTRIASDLHDDIGSSLSQIAILSEVARHKSGDNGATEPLMRIADTSRDLVDSMSDIVWAINPEKDHLSDLVQRMRRFAEEMLDAKDIGYRFAVPEHLKDIALGADLRRETYLIFKECINNLAKYSAATEAQIEVAVRDNRLSVNIRDNGRGFDVEHAMNGGTDGFGGNGLFNMRRRAAQLGGEFAIESTAGVGTVVILNLPITK